MSNEEDKNFNIEDLLNVDKIPSFYPQKGSLVWCGHKGVPYYTKKSREEFLKYRAQKKKEEEEFRQKRMEEYNLLDDRRYIFTFEQYCEFLKDKDFDIEQCSVENVIKREREERLRKEAEEERKRIEEERLIEELRNYEEDEYREYFYEGEPFLDSNYYSNEESDTNEHCDEFNYYDNY